MADVCERSEVDLIPIPASGGTINRTALAYSNILQFIGVAECVELRDKVDMVDILIGFVMQHRPSPTGEG